ncbi:MULTISPECIES: M14 family metallocarboxypeptidase [Paraliobacillus]|uniref:M14 family metallopeptidase n=1 Tax=Paraliobacillus TaxID=200903 RepID=UPI000DD309CD|nr:MULTISPECIES: M14 family metallocarboxypeptidase [Paraliobacillus]
MGQIINPKRVYTYQQLTADIEQLIKTYPDLLAVDIIGKSVNNRSIYSIKLGSGEQKILINGAHHAREWLTTTLLMDMVETYCLAASTNQCISTYQVKDILKLVTIYFIPMVNPDGVTLVQQGPDLFPNSKELREWNENKDDFMDWKANIHGVDLNRQYPADWEQIQHDPGQPAAMNFKGYAVLSEPEVKAVYDLVLEHDFKIAVAYHSSGEEIFWKYKSTGQQEEYAKKIAELASNKTGYQLIYPTDNPSGGGFTDWFISYFKRPSLTVEIAPLIGPRPVPLNYYEKIWHENKEVPLELANHLII